MKMPTQRLAECRMVLRWALKRPSLNSNKNCVTLDDHFCLPGPAFHIYKQVHKYSPPKVIVKIKGYIIC